ncbi:MAG: phosphate ABC transporter permease subunit PstC [Ignavibacteriae bacterium]|nr:phosphate ABC transporter permease subunit PstC [Ignavibacteriota bacterium]MCB9217023.1 phosphate ABC transporter permease subunit PstC [Ignavibacteria bacterium]
MSEQKQEKSEVKPGEFSTASLSLTTKERRFGERAIELGIYTVSSLSIIFIFLIFAFVLREASPIIGYTLSGEQTEKSAELTPEELTRAKEIVGEDYPILTHNSEITVSALIHDKWEPNSTYPRYGIWPIVLGTLKSTFVALFFAIPLSIFAALYTAFFAPLRLREFIKPVIELLAGFPSVVIGFFCLITIATFAQDLFGYEFRLNSVVGGFGLSLAVIPIIYTLSEDALRSVPGSLNEAALALGATKWQAAYQVMLPAATPGIFAAILLGLGRAFGETMIALMAMGNAPIPSWDVFDPARTFASTIGAEMGEVVFGSSHYQVLFFLGVVLFVFSFSINFLTEFYIKNKLIKKFRGNE